MRLQKLSAFYSSYKYYAVLGTISIFHANQKLCVCDVSIRTQPLHICPTIHELDKTADYLRVFVDRFVKRIRHKVSQYSTVGSDGRVQCSLTTLLT